MQKIILMFLLLPLTACLATPRFFPTRYEREEEPEIIVKQKKSDEKIEVKSPQQPKKASDDEGI